MNSAQVVVLDDDQPTVALVPLQNASVLEGSIVQMDLILEPPPSNPTTVLLNMNCSHLNDCQVLNQEIEYLSNLDQYQVPIEIGESIVRIEVDFTNNFDYELDQIFTASLIDAPEYNIDLISHSFSIQVQDEDTPEGVSILPLTSWVTESQTAEFFLQSANQILDSIEVDLTVTQSGNYIKGILPESVSVLKDGVNLTIALDDDQLVEDDGQITVELNTSNDYTIAPNFERAVIQVRDNDNPVLSINAVADTRFEGQPLSFEISSSKPLSTATYINLQLSESDDVLGVLTPIQRQILLPEFAESTVFTIDSIDDELIEANSVVTATLIPVVGFSIDESATTAQITVLDNEPTVGVHVKSATVAWGEEIKFTFSLINIAFETSIVTRELAIEITQTDELLANPLPTSVILPAGAASTTLSLETPQYSNQSVDYQISARILSQPNYRIAQKYSTAIVEMVTPPVVVSIATQTGETSLIEGESIDLIVSTNKPLANNLLVHLNLTDSAGFLLGSLSQTITIPAGAIKSEFTIDTASNAMRDNDGTIVVSIQPDQDYSMIPDANSLKIVVLDDDAPRVSISAIDSVITERQAARFRLHTPNPIPSRIDVNMTVQNEFGNFLASPGTITTRMGRGETEAMVTLPTQNIRGFNPIGQIAVEVNVGHEYNIASTPNHRAIVSVVDADQPAEVAIVAKESMIFEGDTAEFQLIVENPSSTNKSITVQFSNPFNLITPVWYETIIMPANDYVISYEIETEDDADINSRQSIMATIISAEEWSIPESTQARASVEVVDNDAVVVSITGGEAIIAGSQAQFELTTNFAPEQDLYILVDFSDGEKDIIAGSSGTEVLISAGTQTALIDVVTTDRNSTDGTAIITAAILPGQNYQVAKAPNHQASVEVMVLAGYELSISAGQNGVIGRGGTFLIEANKPLHDNLFVYLQVEESRPGLIRGRIPTLVVIEKNKTIGSLYVRVADQITDLTNATISAKLLPGDGYSIAKGGNETPSIAIDRYPKPFVSIRKVTDNQYFADGGEVDLELELSNPTSDAIAIEFDFKCHGIGCTNRQLINDSAQSITNSSVVIAAGQTTAQFKLGITEELARHSTGFVQLNLRPSANYYVSRSEHSVAYSITNFTPTNVVSVYHQHQPSESAIFEGESVEFYIATSTPANIDREIFFSVTQVGDYIAGIPLSSIVLPSGKNRVAVRVQTEDDLVFEAQGEITVTLRSGTGYDLDEHEKSATLQIKDNEDAEFSIVESESRSQLPANYTEGQELRLEINSTARFAEDKEIALRITETGNMLDQTMTSPITFYLPAETMSGTLMINTEDDEISEPNSNVTISIIPSHYVAVAGSDSSATIEVVDNEPRLQISTVLSQVTEGEMAEFEISLERGSLTSIRGFTLIEYTVSQVGNFVETVGNQNVRFINSATSQRIQIPTTDDQMKESTGRITVTLIPTEQYWVTSENATATISVLDDEPEISISVAESNTNVEQGSPITFTLTSAEPRQLDTTVLVQLLDPRDHVTGNLSREIMMAAGEDSAELVVQTQRNQNIAGDSAITAILLNSPNYGVNTDALRATITLLDNNLPRITLSTTTPVVTEGEVIDITLTASTASTNPLAVNLAVEESRGDFIDLRPLMTQTIDANNTTANATITSLDDEVDEPDGAITVSVLPDQSYNPSRIETEQTITIQVLDNDLPKISIQQTYNQRVDEGGEAEFLIHSSTPVKENLNLYILVDKMGNHNGANVKLMSIIMEKNSDSVEFSVPVDDDKIFSISKRLTVALEPDSSYRIANGGQSAQIIVSDNDTPAGISILTADNSEITEGMNARFWVMSNQVSSERRDVQISITGKGAFLAEHWSTMSISIPAGRTRVLVTIPTIDDDVYEPNGSVVASIVAHSNYQVANGNAEVEVVILDNDTPTGVSIIPLVASVTEGTPIEFQISASVAVPTKRTINLNVEQTGNFVQSPLPTEITLDAGQKITLLQLASQNNSVQELAGNITASIESGTGYQVASENSTATVDILNDDVPAIQISGEDITEAETAEFTLTASDPAGYPFAVNIKVVETGDFLADETPETVNFNTGQTSAILALTIDDDAVNEANGALQVALLSGDDYWVAPEPDHSATIIVEDNDDPAIISISTINNSVNEGENLEFELTASKDSGFDLAVNLSIDDDSGLVIAGDSNQTIELLAGETTKRLHWQTEDDSIYESTKTLTVSILGGDNYTIADAPNNTATIEIVDNEVSQPEVQISAITAAIAEGENAEFELMMSPIAENDVPISIQINQGQDFLTNQSIPSAITIPALQDAVAFTLTTNNDQIVTENGAIEVEIQPGTGYIVAAEPANFAVVTVTDNEPLPEISISTSQEQISEHNDASFAIVSTQQVASDLAINLMINQGQSLFIDQTSISYPQTTVTIPAGATEANLNIGIVDDELFEPAGEIQVTIVNGPNYEIDETKQRVSVIINDNDLMPTLSIVGRTTSI